MYLVSVSFLVFTVKYPDILLKYLNIIDKGGFLCQVLYCLKDLGLLSYGGTELSESSYLTSQDRHKTLLRTTSIFHSMCRRTYFLGPEGWYISMDNGVEFPSHCFLLSTMLFRLGFLWKERHGHLNTVITLQGHIGQVSPMMGENAALQQSGFVSGKIKFSPMRSLF